MTELERRALLGDAEAQRECTEKGIVLPCPFCGNEPITEDNRVFCGACGLAYEELDAGLSLRAWNTRPAPPIGRCGECKHSTNPAALTMIYGEPGTLTCHHGPCNRRNVNKNDFKEQPLLKPSAVWSKAATMAREAPTIDPETLTVVRRLREELARVTEERDAAVEAVKNMAEYIVCAGRVNYYLCDEISQEHHLKYQPKNDGNYDNEPCYKCIADWFLQGHKWQENC